MDNPNPNHVGGEMSGSGLRSLAALGEASIQAERLVARQAQALSEKQLLIEHFQLGMALLEMDAQEQSDAIKKAMYKVERWRRERLCSVDYIESWQRLLRLPLKAMIKVMTSDSREGAALRQNSPWL